ncbi:MULTISPECIES: hypothetical protein [Bradyrhizobium]|uniref:Uncharacterized protein n=1 Tax=Bradyrhizobium elkanii TaxID=29448 RepID=A0A8I1YG11_BRAEL|nr:MULTISPECIES: hypothetical protein [Bradyrhizobium]MBP1299116.1 hypothetical protein [Bradyrhizobium elkanii]MCP1930025.1 hypothetical protein [Bradyrhizobium elkanii]MCS3481716.1 hypothetical protein [Bradyrhizobium elkanii]MCS3579358.1 hypothetical protein [Bradyrhizobium elkanii]MCS3722231.1 hypothetical protein [Bradyrhizobium elkanii]
MSDDDGDCAKAAALSNMFRNLRGRATAWRNLSALKHEEFAAFSWLYVNQFILVRAGSLQHIGSTRTEGVADMSEQPSNGMPDWLTTDMLVIAVSLAIIVIGIWIAP